MKIPTTGPQDDATAPIDPSRTDTQAPWAAMEQRRLAAIMFTDMVGYSALTHTNEVLALELLKQHNDLLRRRFAEHGGREIKTMGDGFLVVFANVLDAVHCAVAIQSAVHERNGVEPLERAFQVRIGVHVGDVVHRGDDILGNGVNVASRIERLVRPGGICVSEQVADLTRNMFGLPMIRRRGKAELKNIRTPLVVYYVPLPWEERRAPSFARASLSFLQRRTQSVADLTSVILIVAVAGLGIWQSAVEHKTFHAMVWFGEGTPLAVGSPDRPQLASLALVGPNSSPSGRSFTAKRTTEEPATLPSLAQTDARIPSSAAPQPPQNPDLLTLMVRRDSGRTFHFARYYDHITKQLRKKPGSASPAFPGPMRNRQAFIQQAMSEDVPIRLRNHRERARSYHHRGRLDG
jgi:class 3 adenylate cyclase